MIKKEKSIKINLLFVKKIINFTPTGTQTTRKNSYAPFLPNEIIESVHEANELGISIVHLHARDEVTLENTYKKEVYQKIIEGIKKHCPELLICVSLTGRNFPELDFKKAKSFLSFIKPYYPQYALGFVFLVGTSLISVAMPMLIAKLLGSDYASNVPFEFEFGATDTVYGVLITLAILMPALAVFSFFRVYLFSLVTQGTLRDLRLAAFTHLVSSPISFFDKNKVGELTSRIATDTNMIEETLTTSIAEFIRQLIVVSFSVVIIFIYSTKLALIMLSVIPIVAIVAMIFGKYIKKLSRAAQDEAAKSNSVVEEALMGIKNLKAYTNEFFEISSYKKTVDEIKKQSMKSALWRGLFIAFIMVVMFGAIVLNIIIIR